jgi:ATP-dependent helicase/nuclease subunit A
MSHNPSHNLKPWTDVKKSFTISANAGSGKTTVLIERILALLLSGVSASKILCITYTTAGAGEMQNRIAQKLREIKQGLSDLSTREQTIQYIQSLNAIDSKFIDSTFYKVYEEILKPAGGIETSTFHAFCLKILSNFTTEAGLGIGFKILTSDADKNEITNDVKNLLFAEKIFESENMDILSLHGGGGDGLDGLIRSLVLKKDKIINIDRAKLEDFICTNIFPLQNLAHKQYNDLFYNDLLCSIQLDKIEEKFLDTHTKKALNKYSSSPSFDNMLAIFLTGGEIRKLYLKEGVPQVMQHMAQVAFNTLQQKLLCKEAQKTLLTYNFAIRVIKHYEDVKKLKGLIDFDDIVLKTKTLLTNNEFDIREWIVFKLGERIEHILVDEAQDTNNNQWQIIFNGIFREFFEGDTYGKTIFVVGDEKQMIYSFQGSEDCAFKKMYTNCGSEAEIENIYLEANYRSSKVILDIVDKVFNFQEVVDIYGFGAKHLAIKTDKFGIVEVFEPQEQNEKTTRAKSEGGIDADMLFETKETQDYKSDELADQIVKCITDIVFNKNVKPNEIMLLAKSRDETMFNAINLRLLQSGLELEDINHKTLDSLTIVQDFMNLTRFIFNPWDEFNLHKLLTSKICGLSQQEAMLLIFAKNHGQQPISLYDAILQIDQEQIKNATLWLLTENRSVFTDCTYEALASKLNALTAFALRIKQDLGLGFKPFFYNLYLNIKDKYDAFNARLCSYILSEVDDFANKTQTATPLGFIYHYESIKDCKITNSGQAIAQNVVSFSTIHSSKGLESRVVIILDADKQRGHNSKKDIIFLEQENVMLCEPSKDAAKAIKNQACIDAITAFELAKQKEDLNLLYVALTRAKEQLYIFNKNPAKQDSVNSWFGLVKNAINDMTNGGSKIIYNHSNSSIHNAQNNDIKDIVFDLSNLVTREQFCIKREVQFTSFASVQAVNDDFDKDAQFEDETDSDVKGWTSRVSVAYGQAMHSLCESGDCIETKEDCLVLLRLINYKGEHGDLVTKFLAIKQKFAWIFDVNLAIPEASISCKSTDAHQILFGRADRIVFKDKKIIIIDFKTDRNPAQSAKFINDAYKKQLLFYKQILQNIYEDVKIECYILWTENCTMISLDI